MIFYREFLCRIFLKTNLWYFMFSARIKSAHLQIPRRLWREELWWIFHLRIYNEIIAGDETPNETITSCVENSVWITIAPDGYKVIHQNTSLGRYKDDLVLIFVDVLLIKSYTAHFMTFNDHESDRTIKFFQIIKAVRRINFHKKFSSKLSSPNRQLFDA